MAAYGEIPMAAVIGDEGRPETTAVDNLMHPICTPGLPPASAAQPLAS